MHAHIKTFFPIWLQGEGLRFESWVVSDLFTDCHLCSVVEVLELFLVLFIHTFELTFY